MTYYEDNREKMKAATRKWQKKNYERFLWFGAKHRARRKSVLFDIDSNDIVIPERCPILGVPLIRNGTLKNKDYSPSIDRIDPSKGYVKDNIQMISVKANQMKSNASVEELQTFSKWINKTYSKI